MKTMLVIVILGLMGLLGYLAYVVRTIDHDPAVWHVEPLNAPPSDSPNDFRVAPPEVSEHPVQLDAPVYAGDARTLAAAFDEFIMAQPRVERVAGTVDEAWLTYVQRTETLMMPDYISVRFYDLEGAETEIDTAQTSAASGATGTDATDAAPAPTVEPRATVAIYSRSRFGYGDMGLNEERVTSWLRALDSFVADE
ncbi:DUF1499 domain-containing protein [Rhodobacteraceae bacterium 2CG4]|uniref:DUF1499 domain-containing protein n=1 Tax=Halovulum marinum TaxID=2662447 RepID=A0A6L5Z1E7_9RHOB|nr:DUF1499 domain-containing protein [Halovulum marinum]MSU89885.1 DUF1499 domain-containing protein [Halovulum marinum]